jgi:hypothetical protein
VSSRARGTRRPARSPRTGHPVARGLERLAGRVNGTPRHGPPHSPAGRGASSDICRRMIRISSRSPSSAAMRRTSSRSAERTRRRAAASRRAVRTASESLSPLARTMSRAASEASSRRTCRDRLTAWTVARIMLQVAAGFTVMVVLQSYRPGPARGIALSRLLRCCPFRLLLLPAHGRELGRSRSRDRLRRGPHRGRPAAGGHGPPYMIGGQRYRVPREPVEGSGRPPRCSTPSARSPATAPRRHRRADADRGDKETARGKTAGRGTGGRLHWRRTT